MTTEERREAVARLLKNAPDVLTPREVAKWTRYGKNTVYAMLKDGILPGYVFRGSYLVGKEDLIDFMVEHTDDVAHRYHGKGGGREWIVTVSCKHTPNTLPSNRRRKFCISANANARGCYRTAYCLARTAERKQGNTRYAETMSSPALKICTHTIFLVYSRQSQTHRRYEI